VSPSGKGGRVLILGGTFEARQLASALDREGVAVVTSLAGRLSAPRLPAGETRFGGFGSSEGLASWLVQRGVAAVVDATHPFAARISASAVAACASTDVPLLRLERPPWHEQPGDRWLRVDDLQAAADLVSTIGRRAWLTVGRQGVGAFATVDACWFLIRCIESPEPPLPPRCQVMLDRGPYTLTGELAVIDNHEIDVLVTKESGGAATEAKLEAARLRGLPVLVVQRPTGPGGASVSSIADATAWALSVVDGGAIRTALPRNR
jgi:precorrin-6A/cobalt-precorrin-6A reductase